jgi:hypothetical protein
VLAVVDGTVVGVYEPSHWLIAPPGGTGGGVGFVGAVTLDRERWVGEVVRHLVPEPVDREPDLALLLRLNQSWYEGIPDDELYEGREPGGCCRQPELNA